MYKYFINKLKAYIFIIFAATIFLTIIPIKSFSQENAFIVSNIKIEGKIDLNFSREKYVDRAFKSSFDILMSKILLSSDLNRINNIELKKIKSLINNFQILEESFLNNKYKATFKIVYNDDKVKKFLVKENVSFSQPKNISAVFFPVLFINDKLQGLDENYFYKNWEKIKIKNELITFILPIEDIDDFLEIEKIQNNVDGFEIDKLINKYDTKNFVFALMNYKEDNLDVYIKTNFNEDKISKKILYKLNNIKNEKELSLILEKLKIEIIDLWKNENIINLSIPLSLRVKYRHKNLENLEKIKNKFYKINIIESSFLEETSTNFSNFNIYYYGNPKKLSSELSRFGYLLKNEQSHWEIYLND